MDKPLTLEQAHAAMTRALHPLGIEIGPDILAVWRDRQRHGAEPLPTRTLQDLQRLVERLLDQREHTD